MSRSLRFTQLSAALALTGLLAAPAPAYLYWKQPVLKGLPVVGNEPDVVVVLPDATPKEMKANLVLALRAGLNVAALQCSFAPGLLTAPNYNAMLRQHDGEFDDVMKTLQDYFKRVAVKGGGAKAKAKATKVPVKTAKGKKILVSSPSAAVAYDQYVTRTYNSFSTLHAQLTFCDTAASIGREAIGTGQGHLVDLAINRMREFRNSLKPVGDAGLQMIPAYQSMEGFPAIGCFNARGKQIRCKPPKNG